MASRPALLSAYRRVLSVRGTARFSLAGLVGRLPISMVGIGVVLLVQGATGSYAQAGVVSAAYLVANAALAVPQGRLVDRLGQGRVLAVAAVVFGVAMALLVVSVQAHWPHPVTVGLAAAGGTALPQVGASVRTRWSHTLTTPQDVSTAYALEAVVDEAVYIVGPIVVTLLATTVSPVLGLLAAVLAGVGGSLAFAAQRGTEPPVHRDRSAQAGPRPPMPWRTVVPLAVVSGCLGTLFGAAEVTTVAFAGEHHHRGWAGGLLALWALGSLLSGLVTGALGWRSSTTARVRWGALAMATAMVPLMFAPGIVTLGLALLLGGVTIAPTMVATLSLTAQRVPARRLTEGMALIQTGLVAGVAPGAALSGLVVDRHGASAAYAVSVGAGLLAALAAQALPRVRADSTDADGADAQPGTLVGAPPR